MLSRDEANQTNKMDDLGCALGDFSMGSLARELAGSFCDLAEFRGYPSGFFDKGYLRFAVHWRFFRCSAAERWKYLSGIH